MLKLLSKFKKAKKIFNFLESQKTKKDKESLFRMLYYISTPNKIPHNEMIQLKKDGWLITDNSYYVWSFKATQIHSLFK